MTHTKFELFGGAGLALALLLGTSATAFSDTTNTTGGLSPFQIMENVRESYTSLSSYGDEGQITEEMDGIVTTTMFTTQLERGSFYLIEWDRLGGSTASTPDGGLQAVWSSGAGDFNVIGTTGVHNRHDRDTALAYAAGPSGGATAIIPGMFFKLKWMNQPDDVLSDASRQPDEKIGNVDCYVLTGQTPSGETRTLWIGQQDFLVRQIRTEVTAQQLQAAWSNIAHGSPQFTTELHGFTMIETHKRFVLDQQYSHDSFVPTFPLYFPAY